MAIEWINIPPPTKNQSPIVSVFRSGIDAQNNTIAIRPYHDNKGIKHVFKLLHTALSVQTSVAVGNRNPKIYFKDVFDESNSGIVPWGAKTSSALAASQSGVLGVATIDYGSGMTWEIGANVTSVLGIRDCILQGQDYLYYELLTPLAGDVLSVIATFKYLNYELGITEA